MQAVLLRSPEKINRARTPLSEPKWCNRPRKPSECRRNCRNATPNGVLLKRLAAAILIHCTAVVRERDLQISGIGNCILNSNSRRPFTLPRYACMRRSRAAPWRVFLYLTPVWLLRPHPHEVLPRSTEYFGETSPYVCKTSPHVCRTSPYVCRTSPYVYLCTRVYHIYHEHLPTYRV
jgi:hypothetical protein